MTMPARFKVDDQGVIIDSHFLDQARREPWYQAVLRARRTLRVPQLVRVVRTDGTVEEVVVEAYTITSPQRVLAKAGDKGNLVPISSEHLEDPGIIDRMHAEAMNHAES